MKKKIIVYYKGFRKITLKGKFTTRIPIYKIKVEDKKIYYSLRELLKTYYE